MESINKFLDLSQNYDIKLSRIGLANQSKILKAFKDNKISLSNFVIETGYGIDNWSRTMVNSVYADVFKAQKALVSLNFVSGTHAIATALSANLKPNSRLISLTGKLYDSLDAVIGFHKFHKHSLKENGVDFVELDITQQSGTCKGDFERLIGLITDNTILYIQKSAGYATWRSSISNYEIKELIHEIRARNINQPIFVDNCYGEFVEDIEPIEAGANLAIGSLIKNPGSSLAISGGYIVGDSELVDNCATRLSAPGIDGNQGLNFDQSRLILQGLFLSPQSVMNSLRFANLLSLGFQEKGYDVLPKPNLDRFDIIQTIILKNRENLIRFCRLFQTLLPIDSFVVPQPAKLPGYKDEVIMASGGFVDGSTIELSADAPLREPFAVYVQGGLAWPHCLYVFSELMNF